MGLDYCTFCLAGGIVPWPDTGISLTRVFLDPTWWDLFDPNIKVLRFLGKISQTRSWLTWPKQQKKYPTRVKKIWPGAIGSCRVRFVVDPSQAMQGRSLEILYRDLSKYAWHPVCVHPSPHSPLTPLLCCHNFFLDNYIHRRLIFVNKNW